MAQYAVLSHPDVATVGHRTTATGWSPRLKLVCFIGCATACWALVLAPFYLFG